MKNPFVATTLLLTVGYPSALAAEVIGVLPSSVVSFPVFLGCFVASGILAIAFHDYSGRTNYAAHRERKPAVPPAKAARDTAWVHHTISA